MKRNNFDIKFSVKLTLLIKYIFNISNEIKLSAVTYSLLTPALFVLYLQSTSNAYFIAAFRFMRYLRRTKECRCRNQRNYMEKRKTSKTWKKEQKKIGKK